MKSFTKAQFEAFAKLEKFIWHAENRFELGLHDIQVEALVAKKALKKVLGTEYEKIFETKEWKR